MSNTYDPFKRPVPRTKPRPNEKLWEVYESPNRHYRITLQPRRRFSDQQREVDDGCADLVVPEYAMSKVIAVLGSALFFVIAPLVLAGFVPWWVTQWEFRPAFFGVDLTRILGGILIIVGVPGVVDSFFRFALFVVGVRASFSARDMLEVAGLLM